MKAEPSGAQGCVFCGADDRGWCFAVVDFEWAILWQVGWCLDSRLWTSKYSNFWFLDFKYSNCRRPDIKDINVRLSDFKYSIFVCVDFEVQQF